jgi:hypothetical protein
LSTEITNNPSQKENGSTTKVLIIDNDPAILEVMDNYFSTKGFIPLLADESRAGLEASPLRHPDGTLHGVLEVTRNITEGLSTEAQLRGQECDYVQSFLFSRPLAAEEFVPFFEPLLQQNRKYF